MFFVIDDNEIMAECIMHAIGDNALIFSNAIDAMNKISNGCIPNMIFLDILLDGPDGFTFLNELASYSDTSKIPVVIVTSFNFKQNDLVAYGVVEVLNKDTMRPDDIRRCIERYAK